MAFNIGEVVRYLEEMGVYEYILPFLLIFSVVFAILEKVKIFGTIRVDNTDVPRSSVNAIVAAVMGIMFIGKPEVVSVINNFLPNVAMTIVVILMFLLIASMVAGHGSGEELRGFTSFITWAAGIIGVIALVIALMPTFNWRLSTYEIERLVAIGTIVLLVIGLPVLVAVGGRRRSGGGGTGSAGTTP